MAKRQDLRLDDDGDLYISSVTGDFEIIESDNQHVGDILQAVTGDYKEFPLIGVNFFLFENSTGEQQSIERIIRTQLLSDAYQVTKIIFAKTTDINLSDITVYANEPAI